MPPGPVPAELSAEIALVYYIDFALTICFADRTIIGTLIPGVALEGSVFGGFTVPVFARAGMEILVTVLDIQILPQASLSFKSGTTVCLAFDIALTPLKIVVQGLLSFWICIVFCELCFSVFGESICIPIPCGFEFCPDATFPIWEWSAKKIQKNMCVLRCVFCNLGAHWTTFALQLRDLQHPSGFDATSH